jgi:ABC-type transport system involved in multi-copper enzyme maturation permease subunit
MSASTNTTTAQAQLDVRRTAPIALGRTDYLSVLLRLIGMDLYKVRQRLLSLMLLLIATVLIGGGFLVGGATAIRDVNLPATSFQTYSCAQFPHDPQCLDHPPTQADYQRAKREAVDGIALYLNMPGAWNAQERFVIEELVALGVILAGTLVGGEYSLGAVRLMFTRGPSRLQFLIAKLVVLAICAAPTVLFLILLGSGVGAAMAQLAGIGAGFGFLTPAVFGHFVLFALLGMLYWYSFMLMATFFGVAGRSTVAGIVGPLVWLLVEAPLSVFLSQAPGFAQRIPDFFLGNNLLSLLHDQEHALAIGPVGAYPVGQSLLVIAAYLFVFVGVACWLTARRDVTQ